jgi:Magnesium chelatase, subunit ChlI
MLARRLTTILPAMRLAEALETTRIHRVAGRTGDRTALVTTRPCRAPQHTISGVRSIGEGPQPLVEGCREDSSQALCGSNRGSPAAVCLLAGSSRLTRALSHTAVAY